MAKLIVGVNDLATVNPKLVKEWNYEKNNKTPQDFTRGSGKKVWWVCSKGHTYEAIISNRTFLNRGCPYCASFNSKLLFGFNDLATKHPEVVKYWDYKKNDKTPKDFTYGSGKKVWWICPKGHSYQMAIHKRTQGRSCPVCSGKVIVKGDTDFATHRPDLLIEWDYEKNDKLPQEYSVYSGQKVYWKCKNGHSYSCIIGSRTRDNVGCPYCAGKRAIIGVNDLVTLNVSFLNEWNYERNTKLPQDYMKYSDAKVWWKCEKGHEWQAAISNRTAGKGCPYCSGRLPIVGKTDLLSQCPDIAKEWNYEKNYPLTPQNVGKGSGKKVWWKCKQGHEWQTVICDRTHGKGCPYCSGRLPIVGKTDLATTNPEPFKARDYEKNDKLPQEYKPYSGTKVWWKCENEHSWAARIADRTKNRNCPYCSGSIAEKTVYSILKDVGISFVAEKKFTNDMYISFYPYDIWVESKGLIIELDGKQHFMNIDFFDKQLSFEKRIKYDNLKNNYCLKKGFALLRIPYIYEPQKDLEQYKKLILDFLSSKVVPDFIIDYYEQYKFSNYSSVARVLNKRFVL